MITREAKFSVGQSVKTKTLDISTHTRLPKYCMGKVGVISAMRGFHVFPDSNSQKIGEDPQWLYSVKFEARELFGPDNTATHNVYVDLWEPYFE